MVSMVCGLLMESLQLGEYTHCLGQSSMHLVLFVGILPVLLCSISSQCFQPRAFDTVGLLARNLGSLKLLANCTMDISDSDQVSIHLIG